MEAPATTPSCCLACGAPVEQPVRGRRRLYCSDSCRQITWAKRRYEGAPAAPGAAAGETTCPLCGKGFTPVKEGHLYCSTTCRSAACKLRKEEEAMQPEPQVRSMKGKELRQVSVLLPLELVKKLAVTAIELAVPQDDIVEQALERYFSGELDDRATPPEDAAPAPIRRWPATPGVHTPIYGYTPEGEPDLEEQITIRRVKELRAEGLQLKEIAARLSEEGVTTRSGGAPGKTFVHRLLRREEPGEAGGGDAEEEEETVPLSTFLAEHSVAEDAALPDPVQAAVAELVATSVGEAPFAREGEEAAEARRAPAAPPRPCLVCGRSVGGRSDRLYCSTDCKDAARNQRRSGSEPAPRPEGAPAAPGRDGKSRRLTFEQELEVVELYQGERERKDSIAEAYGLTPSGIDLILRAHGVKDPCPGFPEGRREELFARIRRRQPREEIATWAGLSPATIYVVQRYLWTLEEKARRAAGGQDASPEPAPERWEAEAKATIERWNREKPKDEPAAPAPQPEPDPGARLWKKELVKDRKVRCAVCKDRIIPHGVNNRPAWRSLVPPSVLLCRECSQPYTMGNRRFEP